MGKYGKIVTPTPSTSPPTALMNGAQNSPPHKVISSNIKMPQQYAEPPSSLDSPAVKPTSKIDELQGEEMR